MLSLIGTVRTNVLCVALCVLEFAFLSKRSEVNMRALTYVLTGFRKPLEPREVEVPALCDGEILVKLTASGICGSITVESAGASITDLKTAISAIGACEATLENVTVTADDVAGGIIGELCTGTVKNCMVNIKGLIQLYTCWNNLSTCNIH